MYKRLTGIVALMCIGLLAGCAQKSKQPETARKQTTSNKVTSVKSVYYQNLSKADKEKIRFDFTIDADDTQDNVADPVYVVSMKITNHTHKTIKFEQTKFIYLYDVDKVQSTHNGTLSVKTNQTKKINQLFEKVPEQATIGSGIIEYLNKDNKLAYADFKNDRASSDNLKDTKLIAMNKEVTGNSTAESSSSETSKSLEHDDTGSELTESQAELILMRVVGDNYSFGGYTSDELTPVRESTGGWSFVNPDGLNWRVAADGVVYGPKGVD